jgi:hypothetical protein
MVAVEEARDKEQQKQQWDVVGDKIYLWVEQALCNHLLWLEIFKRVLGLAQLLLVWRQEQFKQLKHKVLAPPLLVLPLVLELRR